MQASTRLTRFVDSITAHPWRVVVIALLLAALASVAVARIPFLTSRQAILPSNAEVTRRLNGFLKKFGADADLIVVVEGGNRAAREDFSSRLAAALRTLPRVRQATEKVDLDFFLRHAYLLVPPRRLDQFEAVMNKLIGVEPPAGLDGWSEGLRRVEKWLDDPPPLSLVDVDLKTAEGALRMVRFFLEEWLRWIKSEPRPQRIDWQHMVARYGEGAKLTAGRGYFTSRNGDMFFVFVRPHDSSSEYGVVAPFIESVRDRARKLRESFLRERGIDMSVAFTGLPAITYEEFRALQHDISFTIATAAIFILLLVGLWLRSLRWALVVFLPMGLGVLLNTGLTYLTVGHLTMITSAFTAILFGLGVDYGIFLSSRIMEERCRADSLRPAVAGAVGASARALLTAGGATVLIFAVLVTVPFSGFAELGLVAASGVALVLLCTFLLQPALFVLLPPGLQHARRHAGDSDGEARFSRKLKIARPLGVFFITVAVVTAVAGMVFGMKIDFNYDVLALLPKNSPAAHYQRRMVQESDFQAEVLIFTAPDIDEARRIAAAVKKLDTISQSQSITPLFPPDAAERAGQARRIGKLIASSAYLKKIRSLGDPTLDAEGLRRLTSSLQKTSDLFADSQEMAFSSGHRELVRHFERILERLDDIGGLLESSPERARRRTESFAQTLWRKALHAFDEIATWRRARPLQPGDLPPALADRFVAPDGTIAIYAFPAHSVYDPDNLERLMKQATSVSPEVTGFPTTHQVFSHMAVDSFRQGTLLALLVAMAWILLSVRSLPAFLVALLPLLLGGGWMLGILALAGMKFSYANIIALPLVMGLAVDYGVWYSHRLNEGGRRRAWAAAGLAARAILLAAGTTLAGLGAITMARYRGVATMGWTVTIGLVCCVLAALLAAPALAEVMFGRKK
ncbi:MAG: hypothetical protein DRI34_07180 [Deltaproteobacteria bacterium]|nr:MAG: hypothetical protein DRI34_07180 [Deltaproteobacteria bacterium]